jgi:tRNA (guanine37-N1)-methyltransferase
MKVGIVTLFPRLFAPFVEVSFVQRAIETGQLEIVLHDLRQHGLGKHRSVDDTPYGGGAGMVMRVDAIVAAVEALALSGFSSSVRRVLLTPQGRPFRQTLASEFVSAAELILVCGRYEGFDERVREFVDDEVSLGDFILTGGEVAAMAIVEACVRLLPGVLGNLDSAAEDSFSDSLGGMLEYPHYTRPAEFRGRSVPEVLKSGDHDRISEWRRERARERTLARRPELVTGYPRKDES